MADQSEAFTTTCFGQSIASYGWVHHCAETSCGRMHQSAKTSCERSKDPKDPNFASFWNIVRQTTALLLLLATTLMLMLLLPLVLPLLLLCCTMSCSVAECGVEQ